MSDPATTGNGFIAATMLLACRAALAGPPAGPSFTPLGDLPGGGFESIAFGVNADGSVVVGQSYSDSGREAFRWTASGGMVGLGDLPGARFGGNLGTGVSADGSAVVGSSDSAAIPSEAFRWTAAGGMVGLRDLPGGDDVFSNASGLSADGLVVVVQGYSASGAEAFRWTAAAGMVGLGDLPGGDFNSYATGVNADGSVVVGIGNVSGGFSGRRSAGRPRRAWAASGTCPAETSTAAPRA